MFFYLKHAIVNHKVLKEATMKKAILCFSVYALCISLNTQAADNNGNSCNCSNKLSACPQENLNRGKETKPLSAGKKSDELSPVSIVTI